MKRVTRSHVLKQVRSADYRHQVERDRTKYHRASEPNTIDTEQHELGCDLFVGKRLCSCSPYNDF